ncbi:septum formation initiator family protein [Chloroflexia bacterium SDU3-3]|nr:septum formation initiator family protein [Chloroflexia bacterium SDU3-3]
MARKRPRTLTSSPWHHRLARFGSPGVLIATAALVMLSLWLLVGLVEQVLTGARQDALLVQRRDEIATIEAQNSLLATQVAVATSPAYAAQVAREQLGYAAEGDTVILPSFPQVTPIASDPTPAPIPAPSPQANWRGWASAFFPPAPTSTPIP